MSIAELSAKVQELKELRTMAAELDAEISTIEDTIKAAMDEQGVDELVVGVFKLRYKTVRSTRLDSKNFRAELPEIAARYIKPVETRRFTVD